MSLEPVPFFFSKPCGTILPMRRTFIVFHNRRSQADWIALRFSSSHAYVQEIFEKLGVETRGAATSRALEVLNTGDSSTP